MVAGNMGNSQNISSTKVEFGDSGHLIGAKVWTNTNEEIIGL